MKYIDPLPINRQEAILMLSSEYPEEIAKALLSISLHDSDWKWCQDQCLHFLQYPHPLVRRTAAIGLGHIARIHRKLDQNKVINRLKMLIEDEKNQSVAGSAEDALDDIDIFITKFSKQLKS